MRKIKLFLLQNKFKDQNNKPKGTSIVKIPEFGENAVFKSFFVDFYCLRAVNYESEEDATDQIEDLYLHKQMSNVDVNTGPATSLKTYVVENEELVELPPEENGHFYEENIYIIDAYD